jgi:hypothetical protein
MMFIFRNAAQKATQTLGFIQEVDRHDRFLGTAYLFGTIRAFSSAGCLRRSF